MVTTSSKSVQSWNSAYFAAFLKGAIALQEYLESSVKDDIETW
jgi:hypothetical protein